MTPIIAIESVNVPVASGPYSHAIRADNNIYISGQIPSVKAVPQNVENEFINDVRQVFENLKILAEAADCTLSNCVKLTVSHTGINNQAVIDQVILQYFKEPFPSLTCVVVAALPKCAQIEVEAILVL